jgi:hypothetical protein
MDAWHFLYSFSNQAFGVQTAKEFQRDSGRF